MSIRLGNRGPAGPAGPTGGGVEGGNAATRGAVNLVNGIATVLSAAVTPDSRILLTYQNVSGGGPSIVWINSRVPGVSFDIFSGSATDSSLIAWLILTP